ncbi:hydrolase Nlp/P60 [Trinickia dabaoshanensis]|uniref:Hydrolase Nlp/P60 n=1 Tax=Trinickia dabaoshanensis TaxID=564714 RepID=A0A2N7VL56_9BURK|nr:C40 family peptidase [Trinickia dabaoshanensis]PMS17901.1 hydrolase Nlp/P60 [Trinickia dabaoshanensis]
MRSWLLILVVLSLAACSSAPPRAVRSGGAASGENAWRTMPPGSPRFVDHSTGREEISIEAMGLIGIPYRWGGNTPDSGFDCSGLVRYVVARAADVDLPRTTADMSRRGESIEPDEIAPGDLIFFNTTGRPHSHVGIYVGKLRFVNAPSTGGTVRLDYLTNPYWARHFDGIRRVAAPLKPKSPFDAPTELAAPRAPAVPDTPPAEPPRQTAVAVAPAPSPAARSTAASAAPAVAPAPSFASTAPAPIASPAQEAAPPAEDPIAAAADAFEPPPPVARQAAQQARQANAVSVRPLPAESNAQMTRASTAPSAQQPASTSTSDDPIARFANNGD